MKLRTVLCDKTNSAGCFQKHLLLHLAAISLLAAQVVPNIVWAQAQPAPPLSGVLGKVQSFAGSALDVATPSGIVHVIVTQPLATYKQIPSDLSHVASNSYVTNLAGFRPFSRNPHKSVSDVQFNQIVSRAA